MPTAEPRTIADCSTLSYDEWLDLRRTGMGSSDAAAAAGLSPWTPPFVLWAEKTGLNPPVPDNRSMYWGRILEAVVADEFASRHPDVDVIWDRTMYGDPDIDWMLCNPDRLIGHDGILECKTADKDARFEWVASPPIHYQIQVLHQLRVMGRRYAVIAVLIGGNDYHEFVIERDDVAIDQIVDIESRFWNDYVLAGIEPPMLGVDAERAWLAGRYDGERGREILLPPDTMALVEQLRDVKARLSELDTERERLENEIKLVMGDATEGLDPSTGNPAVTWRPAQRFDPRAFIADHPDLAAKYQRLDTSALKEDEPKLYDQYRRDGGGDSRTFLVKTPKKERARRGR